MSESWNLANEQTDKRTAQQYTAADRPLQLLQGSRKQPRNIIVVFYLGDVAFTYLLMTLLQLCVCFTAM